MTCFKRLLPAAVAVGALVTSTGAAAINNVEVVQPAKRDIICRCIATDHGLYSSYYIQAAYYEDQKVACPAASQWLHYYDGVQFFKCGGDGAGGISVKFNIGNGHGASLGEAIEKAWVGVTCSCPDHKKRDDISAGKIESGEVAPVEDGAAQREVAVRETGEVAARDGIPGRCVATNRGLYNSYYVAAAGYQPSDWGSACQTAKEWVGNQTVVADNWRCGPDSGGMSCKFDCVIGKGGSIDVAIKNAWNVDVDCQDV